MKIDLDIIIPCYNSKKTIFYTLSSIATQQAVYGFKVYLINDNSSYDYQDEVNYFSKFFKIEEIKLDKNIGPGGARREGINKSTSKYIMFIDSDDILYNCLSIYKLYNTVQGYDLCISNFILERDNTKTIKKQNGIWLHGKIYSREFLNKHNITFNNSYSNEDNGFNRLVLLMNPNIIFLDEITYVYRDNKNSITRKNNREFKITGLKGFVYNMIWAMEEALKRDKTLNIKPILINSVLINMYYEYLYYSDNRILEYSKKLIPYYSKISKKELNELLDKKEQEYIEDNKVINKTISFTDFIKKVEQYD